jgi:glucan phosphoethanolaminetransferase (alkaline phosphatase superfamily)
MTSLSKNARIAGLLYIVASAVGVMRLLYIPNKLIVHGNAAATASNIAAHEPLFRLGLVSGVLGAVIWLFVPIALYRLFKEVDRDLAALMVILGSVMQVPLFSVNVGIDAATLHAASAVDQSQSPALVTMFLDLHHHIDLANAAFWGLWLIPFGLLVYRSRYLPRFIGVWLIAACFGWLAFSVTGFLFPEYEDKIYTWAQPFTLGEVVTMLWLVIMGAKEPRVDA